MRSLRSIARTVSGRGGPPPKGQGSRPRLQEDRQQWSDEPPECPPGFEIGPPSFLIIGAQKAGTTWFYWLLARHPGIHDASGRRPELHVFDQMAERWPTKEDAQRYARFFPRPPGKLVGEKTPQYLARYWVPPMLRQVAPDARLIVLLRDPIERYRSGMAHSARGTRAADRDWPMVAEDAFERGLYAAQLRRLFDGFPREQVLVLQFEKCLAEPQAQVDRAFAFLGLSPFTIPPEHLSERTNPTKEGKADLEPERHRALVAAYASDVAQLVDLVPELDLTLWPDFARR